MAYGVAAFNVSVVTAALLLMVHWRGWLAVFLGSLGTLAGSMLFAWLWLTTWWCTRRGLRSLRLLEPGSPPPADDFVCRCLVWGGINGVLFLLGSIIVLGFSARDPLRVLLFLLATVLPVLPIPVAFLIGGCIGLVCSLIDLALLGLARRVFFLGRDLRCDHVATT
jgi:hypothetical protein